MWSSIFRYNVCHPHALGQCHLEAQSRLIAPVTPQHVGIARTNTLPFNQHCLAGHHGRVRMQSQKILLRHLIKNNISEWIFNMFNCVGIPMPEKIQVMLSR